MAWKTYDGVVTQPIPSKQTTDNWAIYNRHSDQNPSTIKGRSPAIDKTQALWV